MPVSLSALLQPSSTYRVPILAGATGALYYVTWTVAYITVGSYFPGAQDLIGSWVPVGISCALIACMPVFFKLRVPSPVWTTIASVHIAESLHEIVGSIPLILGAPGIIVLAGGLVSWFIGIGVVVRFFVREPNLLLVVTILSVVVAGVVVYFMGQWADTSAHDPVVLGSLWQ